MLQKIHKRIEHDDHADNEKIVYMNISWWQIADCYETSSLVLYLAKVQSEPHLIRIILALAYSGYHLKKSKKTKLWLKQNSWLQISQSTESISESKFSV